MAVVTAAAAAAHIVALPVPKDVESDSNAAALGTLNVKLDEADGASGFITARAAAATLASLAIDVCKLYISQGAGTLQTTCATIGAVLLGHIVTLRVPTDVENDGNPSGTGVINVKVDEGDGQSGFVTLRLPNGIPAPAAPTCSLATVSGAAGGARYVKVALYDPYGETNASAETSAGTASANQGVHVTSPTLAANPGAITYDVFVGATAGSETKQNGSPIAIGTDWTEPASGLISGGAVPTVNNSGPISQLTTGACSLVVAQGSGSATQAVAA